MSCLVSDQFFKLEKTSLLTFTCFLWSGLTDLSVFSFSGCHLDQPGKHPKTCEPSLPSVSCTVMTTCAQWSPHLFQWHSALTFGFSFICEILLSVKSSTFLTQRRKICGSHVHQSLQILLKITSTWMPALRMHWSVLPLSLSGFNEVADLCTRC